LERRDVRKSAWGTPVRDHQWLLGGARRADDFSVDRDELPRLQGSGIRFAELLVNQTLTLRREKRGLVLSFDVTDFLRERGTIIEQPDQLLIDCVDILSDRLEVAGGIGHGWVGVGSDDAVRTPCGRDREDR